MIRCKKISRPHDIYQFRRLIIKYLRVSFMLKHIAAIFLLFAFAVQTFHQAVVVLDYYTNTASFARDCENKARPTMHCNGKCQMMKKLKEEEKKDQQNPERKAENKNEVTSSQSYFATIHLQKISVQHSFTSYYFTFFQQAN